MSDIDVKVGAETEGVESGMQRAASAVETAVSGMSGSMDRMAAVAGAVSGIFQELTQQLISKVGAALKKAAGEFSNLAGDIERLNQITGTGLKGASIIADSLGDLGIRTETYTGVIQRLSVSLRGNEEKFERLGVIVKDTGTGAFLPTDEILRNTLSSLMKFKEGTDRNLAATELLGRTWKDIFPILRMTPALLEENAKQAEQFGMIITDKDVTAMWELKLAVADATKPLEGMWVTLGRSLNPLLIELAGILQTVLTGAFYVVTGAARGFITFLEYLQNGLYAVSETALMLGSVVGTVFSSIGTAMSKALKGDFAGASDSLKKGMLDVEKTAKQSLDNIAEHSRRTNERVTRMWTQVGEGDAAKTGDKDYTPATKKKKGRDPEKEQFESWRKELQKMRDDADAFRGLELSSEEEFWESKLKFVKKGSENYQKIEHELSQVKKKIAQEELKDAIKALDLQKEESRNNKEEQVRIADAKLRLMAAIYGEDSRQFKDAEKEKTQALRAELEERKKLELQMLEHRTEVGRLSIELERQRLDFEVQMGVTSNEERLRAEAQLNEETYNLKRQMLEEKATLEQDDLLRHQQILNEMQRLDLEYQLTVDKNRQQQALETKKTWDEMLGGLENAVSTSIKGIIMGTTTLQKALANIFQSIVLSFADMGMKMLMDWIKKQVMMTVVQKTEAATRSASETAMALAAAVAMKARAAGEIMTYAATAGAAAVSSAAAIPYTGWMLAPAAGAMAYAAAISYLPMAMASAEGGWWEIPHDQMAMVHKKEMVLPAPEAEAVRGMAEGGGGGGGDVINIQALDGQSMERWLKKNASSLGPALRRVSRNGVSRSTTKTPTGKVF